MLGAAPRGKLALESLDDRALRELAAVEHGEHRLPLFFADLWGSDGDRLQRFQFESMLWVGHLHSRQRINHTLRRVTVAEQVRPLAFGPKLACGRRNRVA